jgi:hypothetical protein
MIQEHNPDSDAPQSPEEATAIERIELNHAIAALAGAMLYEGPPILPIHSIDDMEDAFRKLKFTLGKLQRHYVLKHGGGK